MDEYTQRLEAQNISLNMRLDEAYDEAGKMRRALRNALVMVQTAEPSILHRNLKRELLDVLDVLDSEE